MCKIHICFEGKGSLLKQDTKIKVIRKRIDKLTHKNKKKMPYDRETIKLKIKKQSGKYLHDYTQ